MHVREALLRYVWRKRLYYLLIHTDRTVHGVEFDLSNLVLLFAVGVSAVSGNVAGVVTSHVCA